MTIYGLGSQTVHLSTKGCKLHVATTCKPSCKCSFSMPKVWPACCVLCGTSVSVPNYHHHQSIFMATSKKRTLAGPGFEKILSKSTLSNPNSTVYQLRTSHKFAAIHSPQSSHNITQHLRESTNLVTTSHNIPKRPSNNMQNRTIPHNTVKPPPQHLTTPCNTTKFLSQQLTIPNNISPQLTTFRNVSHNNSRKKLLTTP